METHHTEMIDLNDPSIVQIEISPQGTVWVNVDGICRLRISQPKKLELNDERTIVWGQPSRPSASQSEKDSSNV